MTFEKIPLVFSPLVLYGWYVITNLIMDSGYQETSHNLMGSHIQLKLMAKKYLHGELPSICKLYWGHSKVIILKVSK